MKPKDLRGFLFFVIFSLVIWQFGETIKKICLKSGADILNNPVFSISYAENTGGAWSIFQDKTQLLIWASLIFLIAVIIYVYKSVSFKEKVSLLSISILSGGILGNLIERINFGYVIDYIKLNFMEFPMFNIFDTMICVSIGLYCLAEIFNEIKECKQKK